MDSSSLHAIETANDIISYIGFPWKELNGLNRQPARRIAAGADVQTAPTPGNLIGRAGAPAHDFVPPNSAIRSIVFRGC